LDVRKHEREEEDGNRRERQQEVYCAKLIEYYTTGISEKLNSEVS
jgi:hypothetical protein